MSFGLRAPPAAVWPRSWRRDKIIRLNTRTGSASTASAPIGGVSADWDAIYSGQTLPEPFVGPVKVVNIPGKGRGLVATRDIPAGELLLVSCPLVYVTKQEAGGTGPLSPLVLEKLNTGRFSSRQQAWLRALSAGDADQLGPVPPLGQADTMQEGSQRQLLSGLNDARKRKILERNACGGDSDPVTAATRSTPATDFLGLWPEYALINHSCVPNAGWNTIQDRVIARANRDVSKGTELTISYFGAFLPVKDRRLCLELNFGFKCTCPRCTAELDPTHAALTFATNKLHDITRSMEYVPALLSRQERGSPPDRLMVAGELSRLRGLVRSFEGRLAEGLAEGTLTAEVADWFRASASCVYAGIVKLMELSMQLDGQAMAHAQHAAPQVSACDGEADVASAARTTGVVAGHGALSTSASTLGEDPIASQGERNSKLGRLETKDEAGEPGFDQGILLSQRGEGDIAVDILAYEAVLLQLTASVAPGSGFQLSEAAEVYRRRSSVCGRGSPEILQAERAVLGVLQLCYGRQVTPQTLDELFKAATTVHDDAGGVLPRTD